LSVQDADAFCAKPLGAADETQKRYKERRLNILIIGSGGREHAIAWKTAQSPKAGTVYVAPGNGGISAEPKCEILPDYADTVSPEGQDRLIAFARQTDIQLVIVGPETPLAGGIVDRFRAANVPIIGPTKAGARLESSKRFAKSFMQTYGIRTAKSDSFSEYASAAAYAAEYFQQHKNTPLVVKADGLAGGKGVVIAQDYPETETTLREFMQNARLGGAGKTVLLEEFLPGREVSVLAGVSVSTDKASEVSLFVPAQDYKRRFDGDCGPNTGGMGAVAPALGFSVRAQEDFIASILDPTLKGMEREGFDYRGFIFFGLMVQDDRCYLLEYNVRLGDPETQAVLPLADFDFIDLCGRILEGGLADFPLNWRAGAVCAPVAVAIGYPGVCRRGDSIRVNQAKVAGAYARMFFAGAERKDGKMLVSSGRVLTVSAWGGNIKNASERAYKALEAISFRGKDFRSDIGSH
jgi:phosphoribosylamine--glycine ligase